MSLSSLTSAFTSRWGLGIALAAGLHIGGVSAMFIGFQTAPYLPDEAAGAVMIELAEIPVRQNAEAEETPSDQETEEKAAVNDISEKLSAKRDDDLPVEQSAPVKPPDLDLQFAQEKTRKEQEKPPEDEQVTEAMKPQAPQQASTQAALSTDQSDTGEAEDESRARQLGSTAETEKRALEAWQKSLMAHLAKYRRYPQAAREKRQEGETLVRFALDRKGTVVESKVIRSGGTAVLDEEAIAMLRRGGDMPAPPSHIRGSMIELTFPVRFRLKGS